MKKQVDASSYTISRGTTMDDREGAKERQQALVSRVHKAAERFGCEFDEIANPVNARANEIKDERARQIELERARHRGLDSGLGL